MRRRLWSALLVASGSIVGCRSTECSVDATCIAEGSDGGSSGARANDGGSAGKTPVGCDPAADAKDAPRCAVESYAIFVDPAGGNDESAGAPTSPVRTIRAALSKLDGRPRIYLCEGTYEEAVTLGSAVSIFGGFGCRDWRFNGTKAKLAPKDEGPAFTIRNVGEPVTLQDLDIFAPAATAPGASSVGMLAASAARVVLKRVSITAGAGMAANAGAPITQAAPAPTGANGNAVANAGGRTANPACPASIGGAAQTLASASEDGVPAISPPLPLDATGKGGVSGTSCVVDVAGQTGSNGRGGEKGRGATTLGRLTASGWEGARGEPGGRGNDGQGGGGGARISGTATPGGGGPGGCGGAGGMSGVAGGSSIAIASFESVLILTESSLVAATPGAGGAGGKGQTGQLGGMEGTNATGNSCVGGRGGAGGAGGGGGGGPGGSSIGVVYTTIAPSFDGAEVPTRDEHPAIKVAGAGPAGGPGPGGDRPVSEGRAGAEGEPGIEGVAKAVLALP